MTPIEWLTLVGIIVGAISAASAAFYVIRNRARFEDLKASVEIMSTTNGELRAENERLNDRLDNLERKYDLVESELVAHLVDRIAIEAAIAIRDAIDVSLKIPCKKDSP